MPKQKTKSGAKKRFTYEMLTYDDKELGITSMARTTGYTCTVVARQLAKGLFRRPGINPPEFVGRTEGCHADLLEGLAKRNIQWECSITES